MSEHDLGLLYHYAPTIFLICITFFFGTYIYLTGQYYPIDENDEDSNYE